MPAELPGDREVHTEVTGNEGKREEHRRHDRQPVDDLSLALRSGRAQGPDSVARLAPAPIRRVEKGRHMISMGIKELLSSGLNSREPVSVFDNACEVSPVGSECPHDRREHFADLEDLLDVSADGQAAEDRRFQYLGWLRRIPRAGLSRPAQGDLSSRSLKARHGAIFRTRNLPLVPHRYLFPSPRSCSSCPCWLVGEDQGKEGEDQGKEDAVDDLDQGVVGYGCPVHDQVVAHEIDR